MQTQNTVLTRPRMTGKRKLVWALMLICLIALGLTGFVPQVRAQAQEVLQRIILGPYTDAVQVAPNAAEPQGPLPEDVWVVRTEIGGFAANVPPGHKAEVLSFDTIEAAQAQLTSPLPQPTNLPAGYLLKEVKIAPFYGSPWVFLFYSGPGHDIMIARLPGGPQPGTDPNSVTTTKSGAVTTGTLEAVDVDGQPAAWIDHHTLLWVDGDVSYEVGGLGLTLEQAKAIARSLK